MSEIAIVIPMLGRAHTVQPLVANIEQTTRVPYEIVFVCTSGDDDVIQAVAQTRWVKLIQFVDGPFPGDYQRKINHGYRHTIAPYIFQGASDLRFEDGWANEAIAVARVSHKGVTGTNDLSNPLVKRGRHSTHSLIARWYADAQAVIDQPGAIFHEGYFHAWCDNELIQTAVSRNQFAFASRSHVEHLHPIWKKGEMDATYERGLERTWYSVDQKLFNERRQLWDPRARRRR